MAKATKAKRVPRTWDKGMRRRREAHAKKAIAIMEGIGFTKDEMAEYFGVSNSCIHKWGAGVQAPSGLRATACEEIVLTEGKRIRRGNRMKTNGSTPSASTFGTARAQGCLQVRVPFDTLLPQISYEALRELGSAVATELDRRFKSKGGGHTAAEARVH